MWKLVIEDDEGKRTVVPLTRDEYSIGRKEGNTIRLTERNVSRAHAVVRKNRNGGPPGEANLHAASYLLEDLTSYNGVHVNGTRVAERQELSHGDLIQIGDYRLVVQDDAAADATVPGGAAGARGTLPSGGGRISQQMERPDRLVMLAGPTPGSEYFLDRERLTVGRAEQATISVNHNSVSRMHCEIHALGGGRFEIVDKGSSNGVRVNAADLRRGIIEAGDVIELGDVKFKFVGAGQIFLPGVNDSQELSAIGEREATAIVGRRRRGGGGAWIGVGIVLLLAGGGAWALTQHGSHAESPTAAAPPSSSVGAGSAEATLREADQLCTAGRCDTAHERLLADVPAGSSLRDSAVFKRVNARWADGLLARADVETDLAKKRSLLEQVSRAAEVDADRRKQAADALEKIDERAANVEAAPAAVPSPSPVAVAPSIPVSPLPPPRAERAERPDAGARKATAVAVSEPEKPKPAAPAAAAPGADLERARTLMLQGSGGAQSARAILEPKVNAGRASSEEVRMLKAICKEQHDQACVERCKNL